MHSLSQAAALRDAVKKLIRNLGILEDTQAFCCQVTYTQCHTLMELSNESGISLNELADRLNIDKSTMSKTVDFLLKRDLVKREPDPADRRYVKIALTEHGRMMVGEIETNALRHFGELLNAIPEEKRVTVVDGLQILNDILQKQFGRQSN